MKTVEELVQKMVKGGSNTTNGWDVVCSYGEDFVNNCLADKFARSVERQDVHINDAYRDDDETHAYVGTLTLRSPKIKFLSNEDNKCKLSMPVLGGKVTRTKTIAETSYIKEYVYDFTNCHLQLTCIVPIGAIVGDEQAPREGDKSVIEFGDTEETGRLFLHFKNVEMSSFGFEAIPGEEKEAKAAQAIPENDPPTDKILEYIGKYFKENINSTDYQLASLKYIPRHGDIVIEPRSFIFAINQPDITCQSALMLYIKTKNSTGEGQIFPHFQADGEYVSPLPSGHNGSLIIKSSYLDELLKEAFASYSVKYVERTKTKIQLSLTVEGEVSSPSKNDSFSMVVNTFDGIKIDLGKQPFILTLEMKMVEGKWIMVKTLQYDSEEGAGHYYYSSDRASRSGYLKAKIHVMSKALKDEYRDKLEYMELVESDFNLGFSLQNNPQLDIEVNVRNDGRDKLSDWLNMDDQRKLIHDDFIAKVKEINISMKSIDTFIARNLLLPDQFVFDLDKECYMPYDFATFGSLYARTF
ncbi:hypothetical protein [Parabacteroides sp.]